MYITIMSGIKVFTVSYSDGSIVEVGRDKNEYYTMKKLKIVYNIVSQNNPTPVIAIGSYYQNLIFLIFDKSDSSVK